METNVLTNGGSFEIFMETRQFYKCFGGVLFRSLESDCVSKSHSLL